MSKNTFMDYSAAKDWILAEKDFSTELLGKCEAVMCQGNGYMGLRCATEEQYLGEQRNLFVAGTFNKFDENEVTELPNAADVLNLTLRINGQRFDLTQGKILTYHRQLNLRTGEMVRTVRWQAPAGEVLDLEFKRIVSFARLYVIAQSVTIRADRDVKLVVESGINGQMTNTGSQHFSEGEKRLYDGAVMQYTQTTIQSKIDFFFNTRLRFFKNGTEQQEKGFITMDRRRIDMFLMRQFFMNFPKDVEEAASIDGLGRYARFLRISMPLARPTIATQAIFVFMGFWNNFTAPMLYIKSETKYTLTLGLQSFQSQNAGTMWNQVMAAACISVLPIIVIYLIFNRFFLVGVRMDGEK